MADEFDIDIYGDLDEPTTTTSSATLKQEDKDSLVTNDKDGNAEVKDEPGQSEDTNMGAAAPDGDNAATTVKEETTQSKQKRKLDDRPYDPNATSALYIADLHWWTTDDDIRGWVNECDCEDELKDITFSEHKVNGKSKGVAFVEFTSPQAAAAVKARIEAGSNQPSYMGRRHSVSYTNPNSNPFRTLPKDAPARDRPRDFSGNRGSSAGPGHTGGTTVGTSNTGSGGAGGMGMTGGFRGRGGFGPGRGNMGGPFMGNRGGFGGPVSGPQGSPQPAFQTPMGTGFGGPNMPMQQFGAGNFQGGNFPNRGGMNMRGGVGMRGRGGMGPNPMMGGMGGMGGMGTGMGMGGNMGGMGGNMGGMEGGFNPMGGMGGFNMGAMGPGFPTPHFNPAFFPGGPGGGNQGQWGDNNPHGAKRPRPNE